jgi:hypothetical protein
LVEIGSLLRAEGNDLFRENEYEAALELYSAGVVLYKNLLLRCDAPDFRCTASVFLANRAFCQIRLVRMKIVTLVTFLLFFYFQNNL